MFSKPVYGKSQANVITIFSRILGKGGVSMDRSAEDRFYRIYWIASIVALVGPVCYLVGYLLVALTMGGVGVPGTRGIINILMVLAPIFPLILSPIAIITALVMKFRHNIEMIWPLKTAILFYAIVLYHFIENRLIFGVSGPINPLDF